MFKIICSADHHKIQCLSFAAAAGIWQHQDGAVFVNTSQSCHLSQYKKRKCALRVAHLNCIMQKTSSMEKEIFSAAAMQRRWRLNTFKMCMLFVLHLNIARLSQRTEQQNRNMISNVFILCWGFAVTTWKHVFLKEIVTVTFYIDSFFYFSYIITLFRMKDMYLCGYGCYSDHCNHYRSDIYLFMFFVFTQFLLFYI